MERVVIYHDFVAYCPKDGSEGEYEYDGSKTDLLTMITEAINESQKKKAEVFIHTLGLSQISGLIINYLYKMGFDYAAVDKKNDMKKGSVRYSLNDKYTFYMQAKTSGYKSFVTWQSVECVIGAQSLPETKTDAKEMIKLYHFTRDKFLKGIQKAETRILYSSGTISRTMFNRSSPDFSIASQRMRGKYQLIYDGKKTPLNVICEDFCRPTVHGGFCDLTNENYHGPGIVLDKNSLYTWVATTAYLPEPTLIKYGKGNPPKPFMKRKDRFYLIYRVKVNAELKPDGIPCIDSGYISQPYLKRMGGMSKNSDGTIKLTYRNMTLTEADLKMLYDNYEVKDLKIISYLAFRASNTQFAGYLKPLYEAKKAAPDQIHRGWAKLMQNGLIGTFAKQIYTDEIGFDMGDDGVIYKRKNYITMDEYEEEKQKTSGLCYINSAIVSEAKLRMIEDIKKSGSRWLYTDTDSIHLKGKEIPEWAEIGDELGQYKVEHTFESCSYKGRKKYILLENHHVFLTVAGAPKDSLEKMNGKMPGIDYKYIKKAIQSGRIGRLWRKPIPVQKIETDLETGTVYYKNQTCRLDGRRRRPKQDKTQKDIKKYLEWKDNREFGKMMRDARLERNSRNVHACVREFNRLYKKSGMGFDQACNVLSSMLQTGTVKMIHVKHENDSLDEAMQGVV